jgi:nucleoside-diphosphate-sugar epimerase
VLALSEDPVRVLVLGGSQFIGRAIVDELLDERHDVTVLNRGRTPLGIAGVSELVADRRDASQVSAVMTEDVDAVVDVSGVDAGMIEGVLPAIARLDPRRYVFISTIAVYYGKNSPPYSETMPIRSDTGSGEYGANKAQCERLLAQAFDDRLVNLRPSFVFGPRNNAQREQFIWARLRDGQPIFVPNSGETRIQFTYVKALAEMTALACGETLPTGSYNVGQEVVCTHNTYIDLLARTCGRDADVRYVHDASISALDYFPFPARDIYSDVSALQQTGLIAERTLEEAMAQTYHWFTTNGAIKDSPTALETRWRSSQNPHQRFRHP